MPKREQIEITAYHEAGHAVMAMSAGFKVTEISCQASEMGHGHTAWHIPLPMSNASRVGAVLTLASGMAADYLHWLSFADGDELEVSTGHFGDRSDARIHLDTLGQGDVFDDYLALAIAHLRKEGVWLYVKTFADLLKTTGLIDGQEFLHGASECVPKITIQELDHIKRTIDQQSGYVPEQSNV